MKLRLSPLLALTFWSALFPACSSSARGMSKDKSGFMRFPLRPTSTLLLQDQRALLKHAGRNSAVYASMVRVEEEEDSEETRTYNALLHEFNRERHVSRWERQHQKEKKQQREQLLKDGKVIASDLKQELAGTPRSLYEDIIDVFTEEKKMGEHTNPFQSYDERDPPGGDGSDGTIVGGGKHARQQGESAVLDSYFQTAPLYQGIGTHYASIWVGQPPQRVSLIVDTSSHHTVFPCSDCRDCGTHAEEYFDSHESQTFHRLSCDECLDQASCAFDRCMMQQTTGRGTWQAYQASDTLYCGSSGDQHRYAGVLVDFMFGCITKETGWHKAMLASGIMGLSRADDTIVTRMHVEGVIEHNLYSLCFRRKLQASPDGIVAGVLTIGGVDPRMHSSGIAYARSLSPSGYYTVNVKRVYLRRTGGLHSLPDDDPENHVRQLTELPVDVKRLNGDDGIIIHSGAVDSFLDPSLEPIFQQVFAKLSGIPYHPGKPVKLSKDQVDKLPTILLQLQAFEDRPDPSVDYSEPISGLAGSAIDFQAPHDVLLAIPAMHYMEYDPDNDEYTPRIYFAAGGGVLGANVMQGHDVIFDSESGRIGFAESACSFEELVSWDDHDDHRGGDQHDEPQNPLDCRVGPMVQTSTCEENAPVDKCQGVESTQIHTVERWARVVENPGAMNGKSCPEVIMELDPDMVGGTAVGCNGNGVCQIYRPCRAKCSVLMGANAGGGDEGERHEGEKRLDSECGKNLWGSCGFGCEQSRIALAMRSKDGVCHGGKVETRPCHIDACGRFKPCIVPFVVHAIMGFYDADAAAFRGEYYERVAQALADTVNQAMASEQTANHFTAGDVKVMRPSFWFDEAEKVWDPVTRKQHPKKKGMKLIAQIAVFNPDIDPPQSDSIMDMDHSVLLHVTNEVEASQHPPTHVDCQETDSLPMAKVALDVHKVLERHDFMKKLIMQLKKLDLSSPLDDDDDFYDDDDFFIDSPFSFLYKKESRVEKSQMISSWTVKTEIHDHTTLDDEEVWKAPIFVFLLGILFLGMCVCGVGVAATVWYKNQVGGLGWYTQVRHRCDSKEDDNEAYYDDDGYNAFVNDEDGIQLPRVRACRDEESSTSYRDAPPPTAK